MDERRETIAMRLDLIAAKAKLLAHDLRAGRLWEGQLTQGVGEIGEELRAAVRDIPSEGAGR
jgi:hypothetical protein